ncbi:hypothetical protein, partial [Nostoc sp.]
FGYWALVSPTPQVVVIYFLEVPKERRLNKIENFILSLASLSFIRRGIEGEVNQGHKLSII